MLGRPSFSAPARTEPPKAKKIKVEMGTVQDGRKRSRSKSTTKSSSNKSETQSTKTKTCCTSLVPSWARCLIVPFSAIIYFAVSGNKPVRVAKFMTSTTTTALSTSALTWYLTPSKPEEENCKEETEPSLEDRQFQAYKTWSRKYQVSGPRYLPQPRAYLADNQDNQDN